MIKAAMAVLVAAFLIAPAWAEFVPGYEAPKTPETREIANFMRKGQIMEATALRVNAFHNPLPGRRVPIVGATCGQSNAFFQPGRNRVVICYELFGDVFRRAIDEYRREVFTEQQAQRVAVGALLYVAYHEVGHALIYNGQAPVLGNEEDAADKISAYMLLNEIAPPEFLHGAVWGVPYMDKSRPGALSDVHALTEQRQANIACLAYGKDPRGNAFILKVGGVSDQRAAGCAAEYTQFFRSIRQAFGGMMNLN